MGMFKDLKKLRDQSKAIAEQNGRPTSMTGMLTNLPNDLHAATEAVDAAMVMQQDMQRQQQLLTIGLPGTATIKMVTDTGVVVNYGPQVVLDVDVAVEGWETFAAQITTAVPQVSLGMLQPGRKVAVRVDPADRANLAVDWSHAVT